MNVKCFLPSRELSLVERMRLGVEHDEPLILVGTKYTGNVTREAHEEIVRLLASEKGKMQHG